MAATTITPIEKGIMRCRHTATFSPEDARALASFLDDYRGKLLADLTGTTVEECARHIRQFRPMMPITAIFGAYLLACRLHRARIITRSNDFKSRLKSSRRGNQTIADFPGVIV